MAQTFRIRTRGMIEDETDHRLDNCSVRSELPHQSKFVVLESWPLSSHIRTRAYQLKIRSSSCEVIAVCHPPKSVMGASHARSASSTLDTERYSAGLRNKELLAQRPTDTGSQVCSSDGLLITNYSRHYQSSSSSPPSLYDITMLTFRLLRPFYQASAVVMASDHGAFFLYLKPSHMNSNSSIIA